MFENILLMNIKNMDFQNFEEMEKTGTDKWWRSVYFVLEIMNMGPRSENMKCKFGKNARN